MVFCFNPYVYVYDHMSMYMSICTPCQYVCISLCRPACVILPICIYMYPTVPPSMCQYPSVLCMYISICVCCQCLSVYLSACMYNVYCLRVCMNVSVCQYVYIYVCMSFHLSIPPYVNMCTCMCCCRSICMYLFLYIYMSAHMYNIVCIYVHIYMYAFSVCVYVFLYICISISQAVCEPVFLYVCPDVCIDV